VHRIVLLTLSVATAAVLAVPADASAAAPTCRGRTATIVGDPAVEILRGTERADVIVTNGSESIDALGGDDLVCLTGGPGLISVDAGRGDDVVINRTDALTNVRLGPDPGDEAYVGGGGDDFVTAVGGRRSRLRISTGAGFDDVVVDRAPARLSLDLGADADRATVTVAPGTAGAGIDGGPGGDVLELRASEAAESVVVDATRRRIRVDSTPPLPLDSVDAFDLRMLTGVALDVLGGSADERITLPESRRLGRVHAGAGADSVMLGGARIPRSLRGGAGDDLLELGTLRFGVSPLRAAVVADLGAGRIVVRSSTVEQHGAIGGFDEVTLQTRKVRLIGSPEADVVRVSACVGFVDGAGGDDALTVTARRGSTEEEFEQNYLCADDPAVSLVGGADDDMLVGSAFNDVLLGGGGIDVALGDDGTDRCEAEVMVTCELETPRREYPEGDVERQPATKSSHPAAR